MDALSKLDSATTWRVRVQTVGSAHFHLDTPYSDYNLNMHIEGVITQATTVDPDHDQLANIIEEAARSAGHHHIHSTDKPPKVEFTKRTRTEYNMPHRATIYTHTHTIMIWFHTKYTTPPTSEPLVRALLEATANWTPHARLGFRMCMQIIQGAAVAWAHDRETSHNPLMRTTTLAMMIVALQNADTENAGMLRTIPHTKDRTRLPQRLQLPGHLHRQKRGQINDTLSQRDQQHPAPTPLASQSPGHSMGSRHCKPLELREPGPAQQPYHEGFPNGNRRTRTGLSMARLQKTRMGGTG
jgi:hypothetical protein